MKNAQTNTMAPRIIPSHLKAKGTPLLRKAWAIGTHTTMEVPKAQVAMAEAKPLLVGNHFCRQLVAPA